jgi:hypothetical protein
MEIACFRLGDVQTPMVVACLLSVCAITGMVTDATAADEEATNVAAGRGFWSFQPVLCSPLPEVSDPAWPRTRIDYFILKSLDDNCLQPSPEADRRTLLRRLHFDLIGLPPTYEELEAFAADKSPAAYEAAVERLLASPHYGERWGRYWLDLVRYAADHVDGEVLPPRHAHKYRDWVIRALNEDVSYDVFVRRQLAADFEKGLPPSDLAALGFLGLSPRYVKDEKFSKEVTSTILGDEWDEQIDMLTRTLLGLTVACARCHDHKFDPITTADYYALAGVLASTQLVERPAVPLPEDDAEAIAELTWDLRFHQKRYDARYKQRQGLIRDKEPDIYRYDKEILESASEIQRILSLLPADHERIPRVDAVRDAATRVTDEFYVIRELKSPEARFWTRAEYESAAACDLAIHIRGSVTQLGPVVPRRFLEVLSPKNAAPYRNGSGRAELVEAIFTDAAALAGRVIVNRVWGWHFGQPLVRTPSNFGVLGESPTHPELLDDLTARFIAGGWSLKDLHREIVCSAAYRQTSTFHAIGEARDPGNTRLWRMNRQRLDIEAWRDAMLQVSGRLQTGPSGAGDDLNDWNSSQRTVYGRISRSNTAGVLRLFDFPEPMRHSEQRTVTSTALQQLFYLNSSFVEIQARSAAEAAGPSVQAVFRPVLACDPTDDEAAAAERLLAGLSDLDEPQRWTVLAQTLMISNHFLFVD